MNYLQIAAIVEKSFFRKLGLLVLGSMFTLYSSLFLDYLLVTDLPTSISAGHRINRVKAKKNNSRMPITIPQSSTAPAML